MITKITQYLYLGDAEDASRLPRGIDYTITVAKNSPFIGDIWFSIVDDHLDKNKELFKAAILTTTSLVENGNIILVHCVAGLSRSPAVVIGVLMLMEGLSLDEAYRRVKELRPQINILPYFINRLKELENETISKNKCSCLTEKQWAVVEKEVNRPVTSEDIVEREEALGLIKKFGRRDYKNDHEN